MPMLKRARATAIANCSSPPSTVAATSIARTRSTTPPWACSGWMKSLIGAPCQPRQRWLEQAAADYAADARRPNATMSTMTQTLHPPPSTPDVPPLQAGDVLSRAEFERRWDRHPEIKKAELIDGMVYLEIAASHKHAQAHGRLMTILGGYATRMK